MPITLRFDGKAPTDVDAFTLDFTTWLQAGETILGASIACDPAEVTVVQTLSTETAVTAWLAGGVSGTDYTVSYTVDTLARTTRHALGAPVLRPPMTGPSAAIQRAIWRGYQQGANVLGSGVTHYRPAGVHSPIVPANILGTRIALFDPSSVPYGFKAPGLYADAVSYVLIDGEMVLVGDYLVRDDNQTFFIIAREPFLPIACVLCNRIVSVLRPENALPAAFGEVAAYSGDDTVNESVLMTGWPASVLAGSKGERGDVGLAGDVRMPWWTVLLPAVSGLDIYTDDVLTDDHGRRYKVSSAELSSLGWRITAMLAMG